MLPIGGALSGGVMGAGGVLVNNFKAPQQIVDEIKSDPLNAIGNVDNANFVIDPKQTEFIYNELQPLYGEDTADIVEV